MILSNCELNLQFNFRECNNKRWESNPYLIPIESNLYLIHTSIESAGTVMALVPVRKYSGPYRTKLKHVSFGTIRTR